MNYSVNQRLIKTEKVSSDNQDEQGFPKEWTQALDFAIHACEKLGIKPADRPEFVANIIHSILVLG